MELREIEGLDENRNPTTVKLPVPGVIREALLNLDYSNGAIANMDAKDQLADQFCLSDEQKTAVKRINGVNLWGGEVNVVIAGLVDAKRLVQPKPATIITPEALETIVSLFLKKLGYESVEIDVVDNPSDPPFSAYVDIETKSRKFSVACDPTNTPTDA